MKVIDIILALIGAGIVAFTAVVLVIFYRTGSEPSTLVASVFAVATAELAICWQIWAKKHKTDLNTTTLDDIEIIADDTQEDTYG